MKPMLRILVIILSLIIVAISLLPPQESSSDPETVPPKTVSTPVVETSHSQQVIKDLLGGAAIQKAENIKEKISEVNQQREKEFEENGL